MRVVAEAAPGQAAQVASVVSYNKEARTLRIRVFENEHPSSLNVEVFSP